MKVLWFQDKYLKDTIMNRKKICAYALATLFATGCSAASQSPEVTQPVMQSMSYREPVPQYNNPGSIYNANTYRSLYEDSRARRVGDIVTINISETSSASQTANTTTNRESDVSGGISSLFGFSKIGVGGFSIPLGSDMLGISSENDFTGTGSTSRNNTVTASLAARVINVLSNGNLEIEAVREIKVNAETQFIVVTGIVRTQDISASNTISSTQIANAKIEYYGQGVLSAKQKPGWLVRFLDFISPF